MVVSAVFSVIIRSAKLVTDFPSPSFYINHEHYVVLNIERCP